MNIIYKIKRFSILCEEQKEFAEVNSISDLMHKGKDYFLYYQPCLNIMKLIEMYYMHLETKIDDRDHWLQMSIKNIINAYKVNINPLIFFVWVENDSKVLNKVYGTLIYNEFVERFKNSQGFINNLREHVLYDERTGIKKYKWWFDKYGFIFTDKDYLSIYKYIALCISGQLNPNIDTFNDSVSLINKTKINYSKNIITNESLLSDIIIKCIKSILGDEE